MIAALPKQTIQPRKDRQKRARFKLLIDGRVKGVWEKKAHAPRLVLYKKNKLAGKKVARLARLVKRKPLIFIGALSIMGILLIILLISLAFPARMLPLQLPEEQAALDETIRNVLFPDEDTPTAPAKPLAIKNLKMDSYKVRAGESIVDIAKKTNLDVDTLISFNNIREARAIAAGTVLAIPNKRGLRYLVRSGDSLSRISRSFNVPLDDLLDWNNLASSVISVGQELFIPGGRLSVNEVNRVLGKLFIWPTKGAISSYFGMRVSPITGTNLFHNGLDITNDLLTLITASMAGRVAMVDYNQTYGNFIIIMHDDGFQTLYGHLAAISVKKGQNVGQGEKLGLMGSTGASTGSHLHFTIYKNGKEVDPLKYLQ